MRLAIATCVFLAASPAAHGSAFQLALGRDPLALPTFSPVTITIYVRTNTYEPNPSQAFLDAMAGGSGATQAGGIRGFQVDLISANHGVSGILAINNTNWKWAGSIASEFSTNKGVRKDAVGGPNGYAADGDFDNEGISIFDPGGFANTTLGTPVSPTLVTSGPWAGWSRVADIKWNFTSTDTIVPFVIGPTYYDSTATGTNFLSPFTIIQATGFTLYPEPPIGGEYVPPPIIEPEPGSGSLIAIAAGLSSLRRARHRRA